MHTIGLLKYMELSFNSESLDICHTGEERKQTLPDKIRKPNVERGL